MKGPTNRRTRVPPRFHETIRRLTLDVREADRYLIHADLPEGTLEELSEAVDHLRATVWAVLNATVDEFGESQRATIVLTSHRIQRAQALMTALIEEIDAGHISRTTQGVEELRSTLGLAYKKLHYLMTGKPVPPEAS